jgi:peptidoglycan/xylan/chitin deacetylase (PgdA/CDA1 family)
MKATHFALFLLLACSASIFFSGCEKAAPVLDAVKEALDREKIDENAIVEIDPADIPPPPEPIAMEPVVNKEARVSILGYHDFTEGRSNNDMVLNIDDFRSQMQAIKDSELPVISMRQFLDWKQAKADIPAECVMITIDDGWKATHTLAMNVMKEFGYPFTVFLYKNYVGVGGRSMTHDEIRELAANGGTISSHSVSHQNMSQRRGKSAGAYTAWIKEELEESYRFLEENFGDTGAVMKTFAFPYGIYNDQVLELAKEFGYEACFTVNGKKTDWETGEMEIGRYVVHGTTLANFDPALSFGSGNLTSSGRKLMTESKTGEGETEAPLVSVRPPASSLVGNRLPLIEVDLSKLEGVVPDSISMRIAGFGKVPHTYDAGSGMVSYQIPQRLRQPHCSVQLGFRHAGNSEPEIIGWEFKVDLLADYLSSDITKPGTNETLDKPTVEPKEEEDPTASL